MDNRPLSEVFEDVATQWVDADAAASLLEDTKSSYLSQMMQEYIGAGYAVNKAEATVKASMEWRDYVEKTIQARKHANILKVRMQTIKMRFQEQSSEEATERVKARL